MGDLFKAIAEVTSELPRVWLETLAKQVDAAASAADWTKIVDRAGLSSKATILSVIGSAWSTTPQLAPQAVAAALRASAATHVACMLHQSIELVWTGPATSFIPMRRTEQVVQRVIDAAKDRLLLTSYAFVNPEGLASSLRAAAARGVAITAILEPPKSRGGSIDHDPAANFRTIVPSAKVLEWTTASKTRSDLPPGGCLHAKIALSDASAVFISSANFTGKAMDKNMEMGVLIVGGSHPHALRKHFEALIERGFFDCT